jgi:ABC-type multidrug transport system fused ATPase/permease subunit
MTISSDSKTIRDRFRRKRNFPGTKQRVSIARAIIKIPTYFTFDDCLSAVDTETEETILNNLNEICKDKTTIIVSHRVSSAKKMPIRL